MANIKGLMTMRGRSFWFGAVAIMALTMPSGERALFAQSLSYTSGQTVTPAYEGWEQDPDGSKYFVFGYMNKNWEEELDVPIGPANSFAPGDADRGQPTHFLPRRNRFTFRVPVPKGFSEKDELVWTLTTQGKTTKAYASLRTDYLIDDIVKASETGALGAGSSSPTIRANKPPTVRAEGPRQAKVGEWVTLVATIADDGIPKARSREELLALLARRAGALSPFGAPAAAPAAAERQPQERQPQERQLQERACHRLSSTVFSCRRPTESPLERTSDSTCHGSSIVAPVRCSSSSLRSRLGRIRAQERIRPGRRPGLRLRCRLMERSRLVCSSMSPALMSCAPWPTMGP